MSDSSKQSLNLRASNLPAPSNSLVGREQERQAVTCLLASPEVRLLTLTGVGGIGKTRLALAVAADLEPIFTHGVCFVPLVTLNESDQVLSAIAQTFGLREESGRAFAEQLESFLREKHLLLVLDNFEQLTTAAPQLVKLLAACPQIKILVTSRAVLHVTGEQVFQVPPLGLPDLKRPLNREALAVCAAITLFMQRAQLVRSCFQLTDEHAIAIAQICIRLEGIPLALELAAARSRLLSPESLLSRLEQRLPVLTCMQQDLPLRQQALRNTIKWSYDLLSEEEQLLFRRLAVFIGGCTLEAIEAMYAILGENLGPVLDGITSLLDKSLIFQRDENDEEPRLLMLETLREFGLECLETTGELQRCQGAHAAYYSSLVEQAVPNVERLIYYTSPVGQLKQEYANIRTALSILVMQDEIVPAFQIANAMGSFWFLREMFSEGCRLLEPIIQASYVYETDAVLSQRVRALFYVGYLTFWQSDAAHARKWLEACLELAQKLNDKRAWALALRVLGMLEAWYPGGDSKRRDLLYEKSLALSYEIEDQAGIAEMLLVQEIQEHYRGQSVYTHKLCQKSLELYRSLGYSWGKGVSLLYLGWSLYLQGNAAEAHRRIEESLIFFRELGNPPYTDDALVTLGFVLSSEGDEVGAQTLFEETLSLGRELGKKEYHVKALYGLGYLALHRGQPAQACALYEEGIKAIEGLQLCNKTIWVVASCLEGIGAIVLPQKKATWTVRLFATADALRRQLAFYTPVGIEHPGYERVLEAAQVQLGKKRFAAVWAEGHCLTPEQALAAQDQKLMSAVASRVIATPGPTSIADDLTKRELEVLYWVAQGKTNAQVAQELVISTVTVNSYLRSIYSKLGVSSRTQAIRHAMDHDLYDPAAGTEPFGPPGLQGTRRRQHLQ